MGSCLRKQGKSSARYSKDATGVSDVNPSSAMALQSPAAKKKHWSNVKDLKIRPVVSVWVSRGMPKVRPTLSSRDRLVVRESWLHLRRSMYKIGCIMFTNMFYSIPKIKKTFNKSAREKRTSVDNMASNHSRKVMLAVNRLIRIIDDAAKRQACLEELGVRHGEVSLRIEYLDMCVPYFIETIHPALDERWAASIEHAWAAFFHYVVHVMKETMIF